MHQFERLRVPHIQEPLVFSVNEGGEVVQIAAVNEGPQRIGVQVKDIRPNTGIDLGGVFGFFLAIRDIIEFDFNVGMFGFEDLKSFFKGGFPMRLGEVPVGENQRYLILTGRDSGGSASANKKTSTSDNMSALRIGITP